jgi:hypothetical protein
MKYMLWAVCGVVRDVWYGMVWCGVVWCGVVWCGVVWCVVLSLSVIHLLNNVFYTWTNPFSGLTDY